MGIVVLLGGLVVIGLAVWFLVNSLFNTIQRNSTRGLDSEETVKMQQALVAERLKPIGLVKAGYVPKVPPPRTGKEIVEDVCGECHKEGSMGAPVIGTKDWAERFADGFDSLLKSAQKGKGDMPARGDDPSLTDKDLMRAIAFMLKESGLNPPVIDPPKKKDGKDAGKQGGDAAGAGEAKPAPAPTGPQTAAPAPAPTGPGTAAPAPADAAPAPAPAGSEAAPAPEQSTSAAGVTGSATEPLEEPVFDPFDLASLPPEKRGQAVFEIACKGCHEFMPPRTGVKEEWRYAAAKGMEQLYRSVLFGTFGMPPKGGHLDISDEDIKASVDYMASLAR